MSAHPQRPRALLILGMHRSGTSAVTRVVNLLGANIGKNILLPGHGNSEGFWEHFEAVHVDHDMLLAFGHTWFDIRRLPADWQQQAAGREALERIKGIIQKEFVGQPLVAIKDPRMCLTAPLWIEAFEAAGFEVQCLFVVRDPREVADSLQAREKWPREPIFLLWAHYMMEAMLATRQCKRSLITYDQLLDDWRGTLHRVTSELQLAWPRGEDATASDIDAFLHKGHRHHTAAGDIGAKDSAKDMPPFVAEFYADCLAVANGHDDWSKLDEAALTLRKISDLFTPHLDNLATQHEVAQNQLTAKVQAFENLLKTIVSNIQPKS
ncbi:sulfotransferase family protein [Dyella caseinilytica]|uniref:Sulfotransferase family protein n=1 Tax=Dyella caseinilytica TaxID=1849581 RepID=A0ABX7GQ44_9GAMM|nr:hypothetical protein [Dyella caseinilytica]QRN52183.1 hypothetical protein ISN74_11810 [Dyella caseinilytica]GGA13942.1 hypothetical protein GCM10011408_39390 [Dyella caseinilytica]